MAMKHKLIAQLNTSTTCTATAAMTICNNYVYCIRTVHSNDDTKKKPVIMEKAYNFSTGTKTSATCSIKTSAGTTNIACHANSLTCVGGTFYMVTRNGVFLSDGVTTNNNNTSNQVMTFGADGIIQKKLTYSGGNIATINYFTSSGGINYFLVSTSGGREIEYKLVKESGTSLVDAGTTYNIVIPEPYYKTHNYKTGNDSYFNPYTRHLYVTKFVYKKGVPITKNRIFEYNLASSTPGECIATYYIPNESSESKFEIEGIHVYNNIFYVCTNTIKNGKQADEVCSLA